MSKTPLQHAKEKFGEKSKLVEAVKAFTTDDLWLGRTNDKKGLGRVSNSKLLRLHATFSAVKEKFGTRLKLIDAVAELEKRAKDDGYKARLAGYPVPRLFDMWRSADKRAKVAAKAPKAAPKAPKAEAKKPAAKKAAAPKKAPAKKALASRICAARSAASSITAKRPFFVRAAGGRDGTGLGRYGAPALRGSGATIG